MARCCGRQRDAIRDKSWRRPIRLLQQSRRLTVYAFRLLERLRVLRLLVMAACEESAAIHAGCLVFGRAAGQARHLRRFPGGPPSSSSAVRGGPGIFCRDHQFRGILGIA